MSKSIPGTTPFDGGAAQKGYALNKMCYSFNDKANRDAFAADPARFLKDATARWPALEQGLAQ